MAYIYVVRLLKVKEDGHVRSECGKDEGTDCEDGDSDTDW